jgi:hypothetical protein
MVLLQQYWSFPQQSVKNAATKTTCNYVALSPQGLNLMALNYFMQAFFLGCLMLLCKGFMLLQKGLL